MKYFFCLSFFLTSGLLEAKEQNVLTVQGSCNVKVIPDRGTITFTAENQSKDQIEAVKKTNDQINKLKKEIQSLNLDKVEFKNTNYNVFPVRDYEKERYIDKGTRASLTLEVTTADISKIGETLVMATKLNIQNVGSLQTFLSLEKSQKEYLKCLDIAADDARGKAMQLAKKLGFQMGKVIHLNESPRQNQSPIYHEPTMLMKSASSEMSSTRIEAGLQQFTTTIEVSFAIK